MPFRTSFVVVALLLSILVSSCQTNGGQSGWFRPLRKPQGKDTIWYEAGLSHLKFVKECCCAPQPDGSAVLTVQCAGRPECVYLWDRVSAQYNGPAVVSASRDFSTYSTLDADNLAFLESTYAQLRVLWNDHPTPSQKRLLNKLRDELQDIRNS